MHIDRLILVGLLVALFLSGCVEAPEKDDGTRWDQYVDELTPPDKDTAVPTDIATDDGDIVETPDDDAFVCMYDTCVGHADCKKPDCVATFCTTVFGALIADNPNACAMRCDPSNNGAECPDGMTCNDQIQAAADLGIDIDGAKGICAPPTRR